MATIGYCFIVLSAFVVCTFAELPLRTDDIVVFAADTSTGFLEYVAIDGVNPQHKDPGANPGHVNLDPLWVFRKSLFQQHTAYDDVTKKVHDDEVLFKNKYKTQFIFTPSDLQFGTIKVLNEVDDHHFSEQEKNNSLEETSQPLKTDDIVVFAADTTTGFLEYVATDGVNPQHKDPVANPGHVNLDPLWVFRKSLFQQHTAYDDVTKKVHDDEVLFKNKYKTQFIFTPSDLQFGTIKVLDGVDDHHFSEQEKNNSLEETPLNYYYY